LEIYQNEYTYDARTPERQTGQKFLEKYKVVQLAGFKHKLTLYHSKPPRWHGLRRI